jgi:murein L,D-transpeptidase YcbB/YkuD
MLRASEAPAASFALPDRAAIEAALTSDDGLRTASRTLDRAILGPIYQKRDYQPIWTEPRIQSFHHALDAAASHGIEPGAFLAFALKPVDRELELTDAFLRYASALARGRVAPQDIETDWRIAAPAFDPGKVLDAAMAGDVAAVLADLAPHDPAYERLRQALDHYRELAKTPWPQLRATTPLKPGDNADAVRQLRDRLAAEGFIAPPAAEADPAIYDDTLAAAVAWFQATHGLTVDGSAGKGTLAALNVSAASRVKQIRWNLERWRSLPRITATLRVEVNVPAAIAVLYRDDQPAKTMHAIVGAAAHPTPVLRARMQSVLFNPPWNVPSSIILNEIRPALKHDPRYLERGHYAYIDVNGGKQLVQLPGPKNALGQIKFEMPNPDDIYMHDTPDKKLFAQARRALSHGCVRVEDPRDFARLVLDAPEWTPEAIDHAIATGQTVSVALPHTIPVYMLYRTAFVDADGTMEFRDDVYGRDKRLADALTAQEATDHLAATVKDGSRG